MAQKRLVHDPWGDLPEFGQDLNPLQDEFADVPDLDQPEIQPTETQPFAFPTLEAAPEVQPEPAAPPPPIDAPGFFGRQIELFGEGTKQVGRSLLGMGALLGEFGEPLPGQDIIAQTIPEAGLSGLDVNFSNFMRDLQTKIAPDPTIAPPQNIWEEFVINVPQIVGQIGTTVAAGPVAGGLYMIGQIGGSKYTQLTDQGVDKDRAAAFAMADAIIQTPLELIGIGKVLKVWKPQQLLSKKLKALAVAMGTEAFTEWMQKFPEEITTHIALNPEDPNNKMVTDILAQLPDWAWEGLQHEAPVGALMGAFFGSPGAFYGVKKQHDAEIYRNARDKQVEAVIRGTELSESDRQLAQSGLMDQIEQFHRDNDAEARTHPDLMQQIEEFRRQMALEKPPENLIEKIEDFQREQGNFIRPPLMQELFDFRQQLVQRAKLPEDVAAFQAEQAAKREAPEATLAADIEKFQKGRAVAEAEPAVVPPTEAEVTRQTKAARDEAATRVETAIDEGRPAEEVQAAITAYEQAAGEVAPDRGLVAKIKDFQKGQGLPEQVARFNRQRAIIRNTIRKNPDASIGEVFREVKKKAPESKPVRQEIAKVVKEERAEFETVAVTTDAESKEILAEMDRKGVEPPSEATTKSEGHQGFIGFWEYYKAEDGSLLRSPVDSEMVEGRRTNAETLATPEKADAFFKKAKGVLVAKPKARKKPTAAETLAALEKEPKPKPKFKVEEKKAIEIAKATSRARGAVGPQAVIPRVISKLIAKGQKVLDFGAGKEALHAKTLRKSGFKVSAYDFNIPGSEKFLDTKHDVVYASNVLNVQADDTMLNLTKGQMHQAVKSDGVIYANFPSSPNIINMTPKMMEDSLGTHFEVRRIPGKELADLGVGKGNVVFELTPKKLTPKFKAEQKKLQTKQTKVNKYRELLEKAFPFAKVIQPVPRKPSQFAVKMPNGATIIVRTDENISPDLDAFEAAYQKPFDPETMTILGKWTPAQNARITGQGMISLAKESQDVIDHETFHAAVAMVLTPREMAMLQKKYGTEEDAANAYANWSPSESNTIFQKIKDFFKKVLETFKIRPPALTAAQVFSKIKKGHVWDRQLMEQLPVGGRFGIQLDKTGNVTWNTDLIASGMGYAIDQGVTEVGVVTPGRGGKFIRGSKKNKGKDAARTVAKTANNNVVVESWDGAATLAEAADYAENQMVFIEPTLVEDKKTVRWDANRSGHYGNEKMEFPNATYPMGRNTFDFQGCGRKAFMEINGLSGLTHPNGYTSEKACYGGACYAESIIRAKGGVNASIAGNVMVRGSNKRVKAMREEITQYTVENGVEAARAKFPDFQINWFGDTFKVQKQNPKTKAYRTVKNFDSDVAAREFLDKQAEGMYRLEVVEGKGTTVGEIITTLGGAKVTTNLGKAEGMDIRLGVDTDGSAWLARKDVMDALLETGANSFSIYSAGYHTPPPSHPLSRKTMINVTVSGYHPLAETMKRLEWARVARANGWNVILREVTADSTVFENSEVNLYNRLHEAFLATDFFLMEQPLHKGQAVGVPEFGLPGCCKGSRQNPRTCDQCEVAEGQGKQFKEYWGIVEGKKPGEQLLPDKQEGLQNIKPVEKYAVEEEGGPDIVEQGLDDIFASQHKGLGQRIKAAWKRTNLRTQIFDEFEPIRKWLGDRAYTLHRLLNGVNASMEAFMKHGRLVFESDGFLSVDNAHKGFAVWAKDKGKDAVNVLRWAAATRSEQLERDLPGFAEMEGFLTADMRAKIFEEVGPTPEGGGTWESLFKEFDEYHQSILDIAEKSGVISKKLRQDWDGLVYVPFYRVFEDPITREEYLRNPGKAKNIATKLKKIKGSKKRIAEPIENVVSNWGYLLQESMRNNARSEAYFIANQMNQDMGVDVVTEVPESEIELTGQDRRGVITYQTKGGDDYVLSFLNKGHRQYFKVHDVDLYNALTTVNADGFGKLFNVVFGTPKRLLTYGATFTPAFRIANALRDTLHTWMITPGMTFKPFIDSAVGFVAAMREDNNYMQALAAGGLHGGSYVHAGDQKSMARLTKQLLKDHKGATILDTPRKILEFWDRIGAASENAARVQLYKKLRGEGEGGLEAAFEARDLLDFSLKGQANIVQALTRMIPFFGARLQGNYRLGRAAMDNKIAFATKGLILATASLGLWALYKDDEDYKALEDWQKWTYYYFKIGDQKFFIPKPFEVGAIFSSAIQSAADVHAGNEDLGFLWDFIGHTATETFAFNPIPQAALPLVEQWANRSYFTGRPIEGFHLKNLKPGERAEHYTSETLQLLGRKWGIPPKRAEALILGYFSNVGATIMMGTDQVARWFGDFPEKPTLRPQDYRMSFGRFWSQGPARNTKYMTRFYDMAEESNELIQTVKHLVATGRIDEARELRAANTGKMRLNKAFTTMKKRLSKIRKIEKKVHRSTQLTAEQKREKIEALSERRNLIAKRAYDLWQRVIVDRD